jgi:hypothetical protein
MAPLMTYARRLESQRPPWVRVEAERWPQLRRYRWPRQPCAQRLLRRYLPVPQASVAQPTRQHYDEHCVT